MSFALTTDQIRDRSKTVTRRLGWGFLQPGDVINACVKCMGLAKGEKVEVICQLLVVSNMKEPLYTMIRERRYGKEECRKEGFPNLTPHQFVEMFCKHMRPIHGCATQVNRIEFEYV